jgi:hypothetical protein
LKSQSIDADRPGRAFESAGMKRHGMSREVDPKKQEAIMFAKQVAERLETARRQGEVEQLILVALAITSSMFVPDLWTFKRSSMRRSHSGNQFSHEIYSPFVVYADCLMFFV